MNIKLRKADRSDLPEVLLLIRELATYERAPDEVTVTIEELETDGFNVNPIYEIILAEYNNVVVGMAFYLFSYSTWKGKCIYLEDIIVKMNYRRQGIGSLLFDAVIKRAKEVHAKRLQWQVLDWNEPAIKFYKKYNAELDPTWVIGKLTYQQIQDYRLK